MPTRLEEGDRIDFALRREGEETVHVWGFVEAHACGYIRVDVRSPLDYNVYLEPDELTGEFTVYRDFTEDKQGVAPCVNLVNERFRAVISAR